MNKKEKFINFIFENLFKDYDMDKLDPDIKDYWEAIQIEDKNEKPLFTDNGKLILKFLKEHQEDMKIVKAKDIADGLFIGPKNVSGSLRKLVNDGFVEKFGKEPTLYGLSNKGKEVNIED